MVTYQELNDLRLGKLKEAVTDWQQMLDKLTKLSGEDAGGEINAADMAKKANGADWAGKNATVTKEFVTRTADEFKDVVTATRSVHTILEGAHSKFTKHKQDLKDAVDRAGKNIHVTATGRVEPKEGADPKPTQAEIDAVVKDIEDVLTAAAKTDRTAAESLRHHAKDKYNFLSTGIKSFDSAEQAVKDSDDFVSLTKKDPDKLTNDELSRLNAIMKRNEGDPLFAERVATGMGPEGTLKFFSGAVTLDDGTNYGDRDARTKLLGTLETQLGSTLATASHSDSAAMDNWKERTIALGGTTVDGTDHHRNVRGFQAMSNLMRHGKYETEFLNDYGNALVKYEKDNTGDVKDPGPGGKSRENVLPWDKMPSYAQVGQLHHGEGSAGDAGVDPMTGYMTALSHNPDASSEFFSAKEPQDNSKWLLKDRPSFTDVPPGDGFGSSSDDYKGPSAVKEATGAALVAGATGIDPSNPQAPATGEHTPQQRAVLENSLQYLSERKDDFPSEMRDDMAKILVNHGDAVHYTASAQADHPDDPKELDRRQLLEVTKQVSRDQDSYNLLNDGLNREMAHDIHTDKPEDPKETLQRAGRTVGFLEEARYQALADADAGEKKDIAWKQTFAYHGAGTVASFIPQAHVAGIVDREAYLLSYGWRLDEEARVTQETRQQNGEVFEGRESQLEALAKSWKTANPGDDGSTYTLTEEINSAASNGNKTAQGLPGRQPPH
ncbi:hypothetical protein ACWGJ2_08830 [Streptomyces sp. NPDC054796]